MERILGERILGTKRALTVRMKFLYCITKTSSLISDPFILEEVKYFLLRFCDMFFLQVLRGHCRQDHVLADFCDGTAFVTHPLYSCYPNSLQIILYYDNVEVCNPLGSRAKKHKLGRCIIVNVCACDVYKVRSTTSITTCIFDCSLILLYSWEHFTYVSLNCEEYSTSYDYHDISTINLWSRCYTSECNEEA